MFGTLRRAQGLSVVCMNWFGVVLCLRSMYDASVNEMEDGLVLTFYENAVELLQSHSVWPLL